MQATRELNDFLEPLMKVDFNGISKNYYFKYYFTLSNVF